MFQFSTPYFNACMLLGVLRSIGMFINIVLLALLCLLLNIIIQCSIRVGVSQLYMHIDYIAIDDYITIII